MHSRVTVYEELITAEGLTPYMQAIPEICRVEKEDKSNYSCVAVNESEMMQNRLKFCEEWVL